MLVQSYYFLFITIDSMMRFTDVMGQYYIIVEYGYLGEDQINNVSYFGIININKGLNFESTSCVFSLNA